MKKSNSLLLIALLFSCNPAAKISVTNVNDTGHLVNSTCMYALPMSAFAITVVAQQESFVPGPYHIFAEKYLGITDAISAPSEKWSLTDATLSGYLEADADFLFGVSGSKKAAYLQVIRELSADSLILLPENFISRQVFTNKVNPPHEPLNFTDFSVKRNFEADKGIMISEVLPDTSVFMKPAAKVKNAPEIKTLEQKAEEAANFIIKIRKRRFKLISGQYDFMPDGEALGRAVEELNRTEMEYLSLFTGKKSTSLHTRTFHYMPETVPENGRTILFRFSDKKGFLEAGENEGKPIMIVIQDMNKIRGLDAPALKPGRINNDLIYRIPDQAWIRILFGEQLLLETKQPVYQFGPLVTAEPR
ncbi:MAG: hypothetical protein H6Q21_1102 [Bacteroidetes bacterium]|nr:hypothetical protein [Bacteroidota bacterium]